MNAAKKPAPEKGRPLSILLADDEEDAVVTLAAILEDEGHLVHTVTNGALVMDAIARFKPEVCIIDIEMPGQSGYALAREISQAKQPDRPLLIAISGKWTRKEDQELGEGLGFEHYLLKPCNPAEVIAIL
ncbi:MAG: response regulator, partial [Betaproteobacteria bacterium]|nr:response regulator [Betaproteobacteria bacterium]